MRIATLDDVPKLLELMNEFYAEGGYELQFQSAERAFSDLLSDDRLGQIWLIEQAAQVVGYVVLVFRFGMEYGGLMACIDDLFVAPGFRNHSLGTTALRHVIDGCKQIGIRAITVEVGSENGAAQTVYRRLGLTEAQDRRLLALPLAPPTHAVE